jgi:gamma-glutamylcyclotransferase (GGCT)/AIG2-like uncharacterized protein YtfP
VTLFAFYGTFTSGQPGHGNLAGAHFVERARTAPLYRLLFVDGLWPALVPSEDGVAIECELYECSEELLERLARIEPPGWSRVPLELADGRRVEAFLGDAALAARGVDVSAHGGWAAFVPTSSTRDAVIEAVYQAVGKDLFGSDDQRRDLAERDPDEAAFYTLVLVGVEIDNGAFAQLFTNSTGDLIGEAIAGAERFGLVEHAQLLRDASAALFPEGVPLDQPTRWRLWQELPDDSYEPVEPLDERWLALNDVLEERLFEYGKSHPAAAGIPDPS